MIFMDDREHPERAKILRALGLTFQVRRLIKADADMCNEHGRIEIKELKDWFQATSSNKRYWKQMYDHIITDEREYCLLIYGNIDAAKKQLSRYTKGFTRAKLVEAMAESYVRGAGINIVFIENERNAVYFAYKLLQYMDQGKWGLPKIARMTMYQRKKKGMPTPQELHVMRVFDVSKNVANNLLRKFGTLRGVCIATKYELLTVNGVGETTARSISGMK